MIQMEPVLKLNVLAKNVENARQIVEVTEGRIYIGVMVRDFATVDQAVERVLQYQEVGVPVSVGLGAGDPTQWKKVVDVAVRTNPAHVNQVFPAAGYTVAALQSSGGEQTIVNALIKPSGTPGKVIVATGPNSQQYQDTVSCDAAAAMLAEIGVKSVKFYPVDGASRLEEVAEMVKAAVRQGITSFEPTGGIDQQTVAAVIEICAEHGAEQIIPHVYTSIVDQATGITRIEDVKELALILANLGR